MDRSARERRHRLDHTATAGDIPEAVDLVVAAHEAFGARVIVGWDVALLADGPCLVEGNGSPDLDIIQRTSHRPIGNDRLGALLAYHTRRTEEARRRERVARASSEPFARPNEASERG